MRQYHFWIVQDLWELDYILDKDFSIEYNIINP